MKKLKCKNENCNNVITNRGKSGLCRNCAQKERFKYINEREKISVAMKGVMKDFKIREKMSTLIKEAMKDPKIREKMSNANKGKNNPMYGKQGAMYGRNHTEETKKRISEAKLGKNLTKEHRQSISLSHIGKKLSEEHRVNISKANSGKNNGMFGKIAKHGKGAYYKEIYMRSSWEVAYAKYLDKNNIKWEYESKVFDLGNATYIPDFYLPEQDLYIEIKGWWRDDAKKKFDLFKIKYKDINIKILMELELQEMGIIKRTA